MIYKYLDFQSLNEREIEYWKSRIYIINPHNGVASMGDVGEYYKYKFSDKNIEGKKYKEEFKGKLKRSSIVKSGIVISLLPKEHREVAEGLYDLHIEFYSQDNIKAGHDGKKIKGLFLREFINGESLENLLVKYSGRID